jgi:hypothetical protein
MFALIWLAMAAAMLPAGARPANASQPHPTDRENPAHHESNRPEGNEKTLVAAPVCDVWDGHAARMVKARPETGRSRACPVAQSPALMSPAPFVVERGEPALINGGGPIDSTAPASSRAWLVCRDAHAPPIKH